MDQIPIEISAYKGVNRSHDPAKIRTVLEKIRGRAAEFFPNTLSVGYFSNPSEDMVPYYYLAKAEWKFTMGFLPVRKKYSLFTVEGPDFWPPSGINCIVFDKRILPIAKREMQNYAKLCGASKVNIETCF